MIASFNMHITYRSLHKARGCDIVLCVVTINLAVFISVICKNDIIYCQLSMDLLISFITLAHRVWCDHLTNDTNTIIQKIYPTVCVCVCVCVFALSTYVGMYNCMNIEYLYINAH